MVWFNTHTIGLQASNFIKTIQKRLACLKKSLILMGYITPKKQLKTEEDLTDYGKYLLNLTKDY